MNLLCRDPRCATLLPPDAEICDECGNAALESIESCSAVLLGATEQRPVAFPLTPAGTLVGRAVPGEPAPQVDLGRLPRGESVHRRHALVEERDGAWQVTHLGRNPLVIQRDAAVQAVEPGTSARLQPDDWLLVGAVRLRFLTPGRPGGRA